MQRPRFGATHKRWLVRGLLILSLPLTMGQIEDCLPGPPPKTNSRPLALDCVAGGTQIFIPLDMMATADRAIEALRGGTFIDTTVTARIPATMFCAMANAQATQTDIQSASLGINFDGVRAPGDFFALHTAVNLPIQNIDIVAACAGAYGPDILVDFGTTQAVPWTGEGWTVDVTIAPPPSGVMIQLKNIDLPGFPVPGPTLDLLYFCDPTDKSQPPNGTTDDPEDSPRIAADTDFDGVYESLATAADQIRFNIQGYCAGYRCDDYNDCTIDTCDPRFITPLSCTWDNVPDGTACTFNGQPSVCQAGTCVECVGASQCPPAAECFEPFACTGNACVPGAPSPLGTQCATGICDGTGACIPDPPCVPGAPSCTKNITLACTNNVTIDVSFLPFELTVTPGPVIGGTVVPVSYGGVAWFPEFFLDAAQPLIGGVTLVDLIDLQATVHVRSGATAADVALPPSPLPYTCTLDPGVSCDLVNDQASVPGARGNTDCVPTGGFNPCRRFISVPTSTDCAPGGTCDLLGKSVQCDINAFCVTGPLPIPLQSVDTTITADASGTVLFGWDDQSTGATLNPDGTWNLPPAVFTNPTGPNGVKIGEAGLLVGLECTMGVDSAGPFGPVPPVPGQSSPAPDSRLIDFPIQIP